MASRCRVGRGEVGEVAGVRLRVVLGCVAERPGLGVALPPTGSWDIWATASCTAELPAGDDVTVRATLTQSQGANIDSLTVT